MSQADLHGVSSGNTGSQAGGQQAAPLPPLEFTEPRRYELQPLPPLYGAAHVRTILDHLRWEAALDSLEGGVAVLAAEQPPTHGTPPTWTLVVNGKEVVLTDTLLLEEQKQREAAAKKQAEEVLRLKRRYESVRDRLQEERATAAKAGRSAKSQASGTVGRTGRGGGAAAAAKQQAQQAQQRAAQLQKDLEKLAGRLRELGHDPAPAAADSATQGDGAACQAELQGLRRLLQDQDGHRKRLEAQLLTQQARQGELGQRMEAMQGHPGLSEQWLEDRLRRQGEQHAEQVALLEARLDSHAQQHELQMQRMGDRLGRQEEQLQAQGALLKSLQERPTTTPPTTTATTSTLKTERELKEHKAQLLEVAKHQQSMGVTVSRLREHVGGLGKAVGEAAASTDLQKLAAGLTALEGQGRAHATDLTASRKGWEASHKALEADMQGQLAQRDLKHRALEERLSGACKAMLSLQAAEASEQTPLSHHQAQQLQAEVDAVRADLEAQRGQEQQRLDAAVAELRRAWEAQQGEAAVGELRRQTERLGVTVRDLRASCEADRKDATAAQQQSERATGEQVARLQSRLDEVCGELRGTCEAQMARHGAQQLKALAEKATQLDTTLRADLQQAGKEEGERVQRQLTQQASELGQSWQGLLEGVRDAEEQRKLQHQEMLISVRRELSAATKGLGASKGAKGKPPAGPTAGPAADALPAPTKPARSSPSTTTTTTSATSAASDSSAPAPPSDSSSKPVTPMAPGAPTTSSAAPTPAQPAAVPPAAPAPPAQPAPPAPPLLEALTPTAVGGDEAPPCRVPGASRNGRTRQASITAYLKPRSNRLTPYPQKPDEE